MTTSRQIETILNAKPTSDGDGVKIQRIAGFNNDRFSPFLMVDELKADSRADYVGGFPPHPHRGIETLTYMLNGHFQHKDHLGNQGELKSGGAQWMSAGRGIIHSEMPIMASGSLHGFQIWINLPSSMKMKPARYRDFQSDTIAEFPSEESGLLRVIAGEVKVDNVMTNETNIRETRTVIGPLTKSGAEVSVSDWHATRGQTLTLNTVKAHNMMVYVYRGSVEIHRKTVQQGSLALLTHAETVAFNSSENTGMIIFSGAPINETVVHYGPFVMNSVEEINQAVNDYNNGVFDTY